MKNGNWVPVDKALTSFLPKDREYSVIEAVYSLQIDIDNRHKASVSGYAKLWRWSRKRVRTFLKKMGVEIKYSDGKMSPLGGQVGLQVGDKHGNKQGTSRGQARIIDSSYLHHKWDKQGTSRGQVGLQVGDKQGNTTIYPNPNPNPKVKEKSIKKKRQERFNPVSICPKNVDLKKWQNLIDHRKQKKSANTARAYKLLLSEFAKTELTTEACIDEMILRDWKGFKADWIANDNGVKNAKSKKTGYVDATPGKDYRAGWPADATVI